MLSNSPTIKTHQSIIEFLKKQISFNLPNVDLSENKGFMELGLDSLELLDMGMTIEEKLGVVVTPDQLFEYNTIASLADFIFNEQCSLDLGPTDALDKEKPMSQDQTSIKPLSEENEIAIIGLGCRFPGGINNPDDLWQLLVNADDALAKPLNKREAYKEALGGFLEAIEYFDAAHFGISPREAIYIDPQQRILLEVIGDALKNAQIDPESLRNTNTGVYVGISNNDYRYRLQASDLPASLFYSTGNANSVASGRISYLLGLTGPCMSIDTACSSSLVALHLACQDIRNGSCDLAIVAGVNLILEPVHTQNLNAANMLSPEGRCKSFDISANGFVRSEGFGVVIIARQDLPYKPLAFIKGSAVNQDGHSSGLSAPSIKAQQEVMNRALRHAGINATEVDYLEAHGSATAIGDTIELNAIKCSYTPREKPLLIGSIKAAIGHTEAAAGIAGVIKTTLALLHQQLPAQMHFKQKGKHIQLSDEEGVILQSLQAWPRSARRRMAGISSFGFSGTNCHLILSEALTEIPVKPYVNHPYQREYFWPTTLQARAVDLPLTPFNHPLLTHKLALAQGEMLYLGRLSLEQFPYLLGHNIFSHLLFPGAAFCEVFMAIAQDYFGKQSFAIERFVLSQALIIRPDQALQIQVLLKATTVFFYAKKAQDPEWTCYAQAGLHAQVQEIIPKTQDAPQLAYKVQQFYEAMNANKIHYGPEFQVILQIHTQGSQVQTLLQTQVPQDAFLVHPTLLDGCFQTTVTWAVLQNKINPDEAYLPLSIESFQVFAAIPSKLKVIAEVLEQLSNETMYCNLWLSDLQGQPVAQIKGLIGKRATAQAIERQLNSSGSNKNVYQQAPAWLLERLRNTPTKRQLKVIRDFIAQEVKRVLKVDAQTLIQMHTGFFDMGMDSLMLLDLQQGVQQAVGDVFELNRTAGFDYPTPNALADKIYAQWLNLNINHAKPQKPAPAPDDLSVEELIMKIDED
jgi:acyl transferase domain-containing protein